MMKNDDGLYMVLLGNDEKHKVLKLHRVENEFEVCEIYEVSDGFCSCKGFRWRNSCKHLDMVCNPKGRPIVIDVGGHERTLKLVSTSKTVEKTV